MTHTDELRRSRRDSFGIVRNRRRRAVLHCLAREGTPVELDALVERVAANEADAFGAVSDDRQQLRVSLVHVHLPKLEDAGFVRHDRDAGRVRLADAAMSRLAAVSRELDGVATELSVAAEGE